MRTQLKKSGVERGLFLGGRFVFQMRQMGGGWQEAQTVEDLPAVGHGVEGGRLSREEFDIACLQARLSQMFKGTAEFVGRVEDGREAHRNRMGAIDQLGELHEGAIVGAIQADVRAVYES